MGITLNAREKDILTQISLDFLKKFFKYGQKHGFTESGFQFNFKEKFKDFSIKCGASKVVLIPNDSSIPYVIKVSFRGGYKGTRFELTNMDTWDFCEYEAKVYQSAVEYEVDFLLCATERFGTFHGYPFYVQERSTQAHNFYRPSMNSFDYLYKTGMGGRVDSNGIDSELAATILDYYGRSTLARFVIFCSKNDLGDFHCGNFGFTKATTPIHPKRAHYSLDRSYKPVIFDYSGFKSKSINDKDFKIDKCA